MEISDETVDTQTVKAEEQAVCDADGNDKQEGREEDASNPKKEEVKDERTDEDERIEEEVFQKYLYRKSGMAMYLESVAQIDGREDESP